MTPLAENAVAFIEVAGWKDARVVALAADFSTRRFYRLTRDVGGPKTAILMQASADQKTAEFIYIAGLLRGAGLSAPEVYAAEPYNGFVLMEDFGDTTFGKLLDERCEALPLYRRAVEVLTKIRGSGFEVRDSGLPVFTVDAFVDQAGLFLDFYFPRVMKRDATEDEREGFRAAWREALKIVEAMPQTLMLRDYMPDNLMDLTGRNGARSVGLLDFQDGGIGPLAYDLASLCECVRRDVPVSLLDDMVAHYHQQNPVVSLGDLRRACFVLSAQRHMRVLGIVARLAQTGRSEKLAYVPRMSGYLRELLRCDELAHVRSWLEQHPGVL